MLNKTDIAKSYSHRPSLASRLPWTDYNDEHQCFLLEDRESLAVCFDITGVATDAKPQSMLEEIAYSIQEALKNSIPLEKENPWILQVYVTKENSLNAEYQKIENYFSNKEHAFTKAFLNNIKEHFDYVSQQDGIFHDNQVTNLPFRGGIVKVYAVLYRRLSTKNKNNTRYDHLEKIIHIANKFTDQLRSSGIEIKRMTGEKFFKWMFQWFNPGVDCSYLYENHKPATADLSEFLFAKSIESFDEGWLFNNKPHKVLTIQHMTTNPAIGHLSGERKREIDDKVFNLVDHLPSSSIFCLNIVFQAQSEVALHLKIVNDSAIGNHAEALKVKTDIAIANKMITEGNYLFPVTMGVYIKGDTIDDLRKNESYTEVLLNSNGFKVITDDELFPIDAYLRNLPMCYDFHFDKKHTYRSKYLLLSDIARLLPFYGRSTGTGHPGSIFFNRGGAPWMMDVMKDKSKNAHLLVLGETGTGKSNLLNFMIAHDLALYNPKFFIIDAGGSFDLLGDYCESLGLTVNKIKIDLNHPVSLNPFSEGLRIVQQLKDYQEDLGVLINRHTNKLIDEHHNNTKKEADPDIDEPRDILGDMVLAALIMITGGEKKEEESLRRADRMLVMDAIIDAAFYVHAQNREQMIASDIVDAFERLILKFDTSLEKDKIKRAREMADSLRYFTKDPVSSRFFNSIGTPWKDADVTIIDFGLFAREGYEAHRSIAFASIMNKVLSLAELNQHSNRAIKLVCDENHIFTSISLLADIQTRIAKMGRKLGLWLWLATQNMRDFADGARRMLSQIETWMCLALPPDEIEQIEKFKILTAEERNLLLSAKKEKGKYTEGVILSANVKGLIRNIPPRLYLAMAATDQDEKNLRKQMMQQHNCSEITAVKIIAQEMMNKS